MDDTSFMRVYSPIAADGQKAFLFLSTVSFVAALDKWTKDQMASWHLRGSALKAVDALTVLMYSICFIFTLVCTPLEDVMHSSHLRVSGYETPDIHIHRKRERGKRERERERERDFFADPLLGTLPPFLPPFITPLSWGIFAHSPTHSLLSLCRVVPLESHK